MSAIGPCFKSYIIHRIMEPFIHDSQYRLMKCEICLYAVLPSEAKTHLARSKHHISISKQHAIISQVMKIPNLIQDQSQLAKEFQIPSPGQTAIAGLPIYIFRWIAMYIRTMSIRLSNIPWDAGALPRPTSMGQPIWPRWFHASATSPCISVEGERSLPAIFHPWDAAGVF